MTYIPWSHFIYIHRCVVLLKGGYGSGGKNTFGSVSAE